MGNIQNALKGASEGSVIKLSDAMAIGQKADDLLNKSAVMLKKAMKQVGQIDGGEIAIVLAEIQGQKFNAAVFSYNREPDGQ
jgi:hypothetical protein